MPGKIKEIELGTRFGSLVVIGKSDKIYPTKTGSRYMVWDCICDCGLIVQVRGAALRADSIKSCGCSRIAGSTTHGQSGSKVYESWHRMIQRCYNEKTKRFKDYGGRGVMVCEKWRSSFEEFYRDMGDRPDGKTLDRINNNGNYEPSNCRWATPKEQAHNRRCKLPSDQK